MTYVDGFVIAVPRDKQEAYRAVAERGEPLFKEFGATRQVEAWGDDVPDGKVTDFKRAVQAREDEVVVFGWLEYPDKATRDAAGRRMIEDPRMQDMEMPFDGKRMIYGGFEPIVDVVTSRRGGYVDGFLVAVPVGNKEAYRQLAQKAAEVFVSHGAVRVVEAWGNDVPDGKLTDYRRAVKAEQGEAVVYSWVEWPDKATRDAGWPKSMADERMKDEDRNPPFDGQRMVYGGFQAIFDR
jgi:uncharacterized protein YbaA (DUF1428 family)